jgi:hemerythrin-like domain-containing protein
MGKLLSEAIGADHDEFDVLYENIKNATDDAAKVRWRNQLTWTVARHAISEELTWYPAMAKHLGEEGVRLAKTDKEQHQGVRFSRLIYVYLTTKANVCIQVKDYLYKVQDMTPVDPQFMPLLDTLMDLLHHHIEHEKEEDMPRLEGLLSREESEQLAASFERTKKIVPTKSHPGAPTSYYLELLTGLMAAPVDKFMDYLTKDFPDEQDKVEASKARENKM